MAVSRVAASLTDPTFESVDPSDLAAMDAELPSVADLQDSGVPILDPPPVPVSAGQFGTMILKVEIIRDFYQMCSLMFGFIAIPDILKDFIPNISFVIGFDLGLVLPDAQALVVGWYWFLFIGASLCLAAALYLFRDLQPGEDSYLMVRTWGMISTKKRTLVWFIMFVLSCMYQPIAQNAIEILSCSYRWAPIVDCPGTQHTRYSVSAVVLLVTQTFFVPALFVYITRKNVPKERLYDAEGKPIVYSLEMYSEDLRNDPSPYTFLYCDYERSTYFYKVVMMLFKLVLSVIAVIFSANYIWGFNQDPVTKEYSPNSNEGYVNHVKGAGVCALLLVYVVVSHLASPFLDSTADFLDRALRVTSLVTAACMYFILFNIASTVFGVITLVFHIVALLLSIVFIVQSNQYVRQWLRERRTSVELTMVKNGDKEVPHAFSSNLDIARERKTRIWHMFWNTLLGSSPDYKAPKNQEWNFADTDKTAAYLLDFKGSVEERHRENLEIARDLGFTEYRDALLDVTAEQVVAAVYAMRQLHGPNAFWGDPDDVRETNFGCCYIIPFPFQCHVRFDNASREDVMITFHNVCEFVKVNCDPRVKLRKLLRMRLRSLHFACQAGHSIAYPHEINRTKQIKVGKDRTISVPERVVFQNGYVDVRQNAEKPVFSPPYMNESDQLKHSFVVAPGFEFQLRYEHGEGWNERQGTYPVRETICIPGEHLGLTKQFDLTPQIHQLLLMNSELCDTYLEARFNSLDFFRLHYMQEFDSKAKVMSYAFWLKVIDNDHISQEALETHLKEYECRSDMLRTLPEKQKHALNVLFSHLTLFDASRPMAVWSAFWSDVWYKNGFLKFIADDEEKLKLLKVSLPTALVWHPTSQEKLCLQLNRYGLQNDDGSGWISKKLVEELYAAMATADDRLATAGGSSRGHNVDADKPCLEVTMHPHFSASLHLHMMWMLDYEKLMESQCGVGASAVSPPPPPPPMQAFVPGPPPGSQPQHQPPSPMYPPPSSGYPPQQQQPPQGYPPQHQQQYPPHQQPHQPQQQYPSHQQHQQPGYTLPQHPGYPQQPGYVQPAYLNQY